MKYRLWTSVSFSLEVEVEAADADAAIAQVKAMDPYRLVEDAGEPEIEVADCMEDPS